MIRKLFLFFISFLVGIGIFWWVGKIVGWQEIGRALSGLFGWQGIIIFILSVLIVLIGTWKWKEILRGEEINLGLKELLSPYLGGFSLMFLAPILVWAGETFRVYSLKEKYSTSWTKGMTSVIIDRILEWTTNLIVIFFGSLFFLYKIGLPSKNILLIFGSIILIFIGFLSFFYFKAFKKESIAKTIGKIFNGNLDSQPLEVEKEIFNFFHFKKAPMWNAIFLSFLRTSIMYARAWILIFFLGKNINALTALSILGFSYLATIIPIPTALGSHEAIQTFAFSYLNLGFSIATAFTMIIRGADLIIALTGIIFLFHFSIIIIKNRIFKKIEHFANLIKK